MKITPAASLNIFAVYLGGLAVILLFIPNVLLTIFGLPETNEVWIRVLGMVVAFLAVYYMQMARVDNRVFMQTSVYVRASVVVFFVVFVLLNYAKVNLILLSGGDLLGAALTWYALRNAKS